MTLGTDIIEIERIRRTLTRFGAHFKNRIYTQAEQAYCDKHRDPAPQYAARFAAKEAIAKALGTGFGAHLRFIDIEISHKPSGAPTATIANQPHLSLALSYSHSHTHAIATALILTYITN